MSNKKQVSPLIPFLCITSIILAVLSNGDVVGGNNVSVGDWVAVR
jgi:hypothetical protein